MGFLWRFLILRRGGWLVSQSEDWKSLHLGFLVSQGMPSALWWLSRQS